MRPLVLLLILAASLVSYADEKKPLEDTRLSKAEFLKTLDQWVALTNEFADKVTPVEPRENEWWMHLDSGLPLLELKKRDALERGKLWGNEPLNARRIEVDRKLRKFPIESIPQLSEMPKSEYTEKTIEARDRELGRMFIPLRNRLKEIEEEYKASSDPGLSDEARDVGRKILALNAERRKAWTPELHKRVKVMYLRQQPK